MLDTYNLCFSFAIYIMNNKVCNFKTLFQISFQSWHIKIGISLKYASAARYQRILKTQRNAGQNKTVGHNETVVLFYDLVSTRT